MLDDTRVDASSDRYRPDQTTALAHEQLRAEWTRAATARTDQRRHRHPLLLGAQAFELFEDIRHASVFGHVIDRVKPQTPDFARARRIESTRNSNASAVSFTTRWRSDATGLFAKALRRSFPPMESVSSVGSSLSSISGSCDPNTSPIVAPSSATFTKPTSGC